MRLTHVLIEIHVVGHDVDVGVQHFHLADDLLQDIPDARGEDEKGDVILVEGVEERLVALPGKRGMGSETAPPLLLFIIFYWGYRLSGFFKNAVC